jgi:WD40 repeat protein
MRLHYRLKKQFIFPLLYFVFFLSACQLIPQSKQVTPTIVPSSIRVIKTASATSTATLLVQSHSTPTTEIIAQSISPQNATELVLLKTLGKGKISGKPVYSPDGKFLAVPSSKGIYLYHAPTLELFRLISFEPYVPTNPEQLGFTADGRLLFSIGRKVSFTQDGSFKEIENESLLAWDVLGGHLVWWVPITVSQSISDLAVAPDGLWVAVSDYGDQVTLVKAQDSSVISNLEGNQVEFSPIDPLLVTSSSSSPSTGKIRLYNLEDGKLQKQWEGQSASFSPDGNLVIEKDGSVRLIELSDYTALSAFSGRVPVISPDASSLTLFNTGLVKLYNLKSGALLQTFEGNYADVSHLQIAPDGQTIVGDMLQCPVENCVYPEATTVLWRVSDGKLLYTAKGNDYSPWATYPLDASNLILAQPGALLFINPEDGDILQTVDNYTTRVTGLAFSPNGKTLATASGVFPLTVLFWDLDHSTVLQRLEDLGSGSEYSYLPTVFSPDGQFLAVRGDFWSLPTGERLTQFEQELASVSQAGPYWASVSAFSPDGKSLALGYLEGNLTLIDLKDRTLFQKFPGYTGEVIDVDFSEDGKILVAAFSYPDRIVQFWQLPVGKPLVSVKNQDGNYEFTQAILSPDDETLITLAKDPIAGIDTGIVQRWQVSDGKLIDQLPLTGVMHIALSPDGKLLATGSYDRQVRLWDLSTGNVAPPRLLQTYSEHTDYITDLAFSADGILLASGSEDGTVIIWGLR